MLFDPLYCTLRAVAATFNFRCGYHVVCSDECAELGHIIYNCEMFTCLYQTDVHNKESESVGHSYLQVENYSCVRAATKLYFFRK